MIVRVGQGDGEEGELNRRGVGVLIGSEPGEMVSLSRQWVIEHWWGGGG